MNLSAQNVKDAISVSEQTVGSNFSAVSRKHRIRYSVSHGILVCVHNEPPKNLPHYLRLLTKREITGYTLGEVNTQLKQRDYNKSNGKRQTKRRGRGFLLAPW